MRSSNAAEATPTLGEDRDPRLRLIPIVPVKALAADEDAAITINGHDYPTPD